MTVSAEVGCIVLRGFEVLLLKKAEMYSIPGGPINAKETTVAAAQRYVKESTELTTTVQDSSLFVSEYITKDNHQLVVYLLGTPTNDVELKSAEWVDVRKLGDKQADMSELTVDSLLKFSYWLAAQNPNLMKKATVN